MRENSVWAPTAICEELHVTQSKDVPGSLAARASTYLSWKLFTPD